MESNRIKFVVNDRVEDDALDFRSFVVLLTKLTARMFFVLSFRTWEKEKSQEKEVSGGEDFNLSGSTQGREMSCDFLVTKSTAVVTSDCWLLEIGVN